jgi:hypothetical protein
MTAIMPIIIRQLFFVHNQRNKCQQRTDNQLWKEKKFYLVFNIIREILTNLPSVGRGFYQLCLINNMGKGNKNSVVNVITLSRGNFLLRNHLLCGVKTCLMFIYIIAINTLNVNAQGKSLSAEDRENVHRISAQFTMEDIDAMPKMISDELHKHFEQQGLQIIVQRKLTFVLLPIFSNKIPIQDRIWYGNYLLKYKLEGNGLYPKVFIEDYLTALQKNNTK